MPPYLKDIPSLKEIEAAQAKSPDIDRERKFWKDLIKDAIDSVEVENNQPPNTTQLPEELQGSSDLTILTLANNFDIDKLTTHPDHPDIFFYNGDLDFTGVNESDLPPLPKNLIVNGMISVDPGNDRLIKFITEDRGGICRLN